MPSLLRKIKRIVKPLKPNTIKNNLDSWSNWDWTLQGEDWSNTPEWKASLVTHVLEPHIHFNSSVLEIGPGAGRWTETLVKRAKHLTLVDLTPKCIELCQERFKSQKHVNYYLNDGKDISFIPSESIDCIWSWDVFVHVSSNDIEDYMRQFKRILAKDGIGVIHHSKNGKSDRGWRSDMTSQKMEVYCARYALELVNQFDSWDDGKVHI